ncbi:Rab-GAP TBC domain-containing protein [Caenorhabditis elegans]|uniref:Rab-GAP TBC domain-containing protein n=1 Tax=Caenorhabditis elegans TaxID=6239 RepID=Q20600_CAEEL|nr:Rab-GAP TBC domain-containing protein [Caenorhabditis elegans]CCD71563.2 Rab-GAP TBC domain-containing protein [Caenorhabditis elegans]|eukprot:NP_508988.3 TBC (Tre-2/Bub2/Cdc16) domain family [Caenorhabditis elegans]
MSAFSDFFKKAHDALNGIRGVNSFFLGRDGDVVYSKNNVCVHETDAKAGEDEAHCPGYLTVHCQCDESMGLTLILQWLPNLTLQKNPQSIRSVSPRGKQNRDENGQAMPAKPADEVKVSLLSDEESSVSLDIQIEECGTAVPVKQVKRPTTLVPYGQQEDHSFNDALGVPSINVIPHTPIKHENNEIRTENAKDESDKMSQSSLSTSCADEMSDKELSSSEDGDDDCEKPDPGVGLEKILESTQMFDKTPEQFALEHDLMLTDTKSNDSEEQSRGRKKAAGTTSLFSVNLGKMRSMRVFYSNTECTSGQLVIATLDSHYKILHFHHGGLDKLAYIFEQWSSIKARSVQEGSPSAIADKQLIICQPAVTKVEKDPEEGLFEKITLNTWRSYENKSGVIIDSGTVRKHIFFASMDVEMREKVWPFLLRVYPWESSADQRENIKNDLFLEYQNIRKRRYRVTENAQARWISIENSIVKDVVRTDRKNPFFAGDNNPNSEIMKNILLNYAVMYPDINYIQGMSDLLAPLLSTLKDEVDSYFCFKNFMQQTVFSSTPQGNENLMETNLTYLRNMLRMFVPDFYEHLEKQRPDAMQLMFVHRWILLCFKREFPENYALHIWECCWAHYRTNYFHLFVCVAIVSIYGKDVLTQDLPHDEILLFFASLANHMDATLVLQKARGLLFEFTRMEKIPCVLEGLCSAEMEQWNSHKSYRNFYCNQSHIDKESCPYQ